MDPDVSFAVGVVLLVLACPAAVGAMADGRRAVAILVMVGGGLLGLAIYARPDA